MAWELTAYSLGALCAAAVSALVLVLAWRHRGEPDARAFTALMLAIGGWSLVYAVQLGVPTRAGQLFWQRVGLAVGGSVPTLWLLFTVTYSGRREWLTRNRLVLLAVDPVLFALLVLTNPLHGLAWRDATLVGSPPQQVLDLSLSAGYYVHIAYAYVAVAVGLAMLVGVYVRASPLYRRQTGLLILGAVPPLVANVVYTLDVSPAPLGPVDFTPFAFVGTGVAFGLALFQFDFLERLPVARRRVLDEMGDGLVVLDADGTVVDVNGVARRALDPEPTVGDPVSTFAEGDGVSEALTHLDGRTITATVHGRTRAYDLEWSPLTDHRGTTVGHVVGLRDVTDRQEYEQRLEVAQRVLRHNLRNDMNVIREWGQHIVETSTNGHVEAADRIVETAEDLIDLSRKTQTMVEMSERAGEGRVAVDVRSRLDAVLGDFRADHPDVHIAADLADAAVALPDRSVFDIAVRNVVENAIEHNDATDPWVRVSVDAGDEFVRVRVADNGPRVPEMERRVLREGVENPLQHGSGVGLWLTHWSLSTVGGDVSFGTRDPRGNVVTLAFPAVDSPSRAGGVSGSTDGTSSEHP